MSNKVYQWVVNGQPTNIEFKTGDTVFTMACKGITQTGHFQWWSPDTWEARDGYGELLSWDTKWASISRKQIRSSYPIFLNMRPGIGA